MIKTITLALAVLFAATVNSQVKFEALQFSPQYPQAGQTVSFKYNAQLSPLIDEKNVDAAVYVFNKNGVIVYEPKLTKAGKLYSGSFKTDSTASCIAFAFSAGKEKDNNNGRGYIIPVYTSKNEPTQKYFNNASVLQTGYGEYLFGMDINNAKGLTILEDGIKLYPGIKYDPSNFGNYLRMLSDVKKGEAKELIAAELIKYETAKKLNEEDYNLLIQWQTRNKNKTKADSLTAVMKAAFPEGNWKKGEAGMNFFREKDPAKKLALFQDYIAKYPPTKENKALIDNYKYQLANAYASAKDYASFDEWNKQLDTVSMASNYNNISWNMAEKDEALQDAKRMSAIATMWAKKEMTNPSSKKPDAITVKQWEQNRKGAYAMYADTYAFILYKLGEYTEGYPYAKEAAGHFEMKNAEYNERYAMLLEKTQPAATAQKNIEQLVKDGAASSKTKEILKQLYVKQKNNAEGYEAYLTNLEMAAKIKKREELAKTMLSDAAPKFSLKDMEGNTVSLEGLKGKVVIVDFWATWCGPCIASMPAMKRAQEKYKDRSDVKFVFIDTWETVDNKLQNATDFMKKNNYPFHVLMDDDSKVVADFKVSGIPTKFIIDKNGSIRFKSVGFGGNDDALVDEIDSMIELAAK
ncbi:MAG: TlpA disulfide reductase family protein [Ferruginibacter sp.]